MFRANLCAALVLMLTGFLMTAAQDPAKNPQDNGKKGDRDFLKMAAETSMVEIKLGQLAQENGGSPTIKKYGQRVMTDHSEMNKELVQIAKKEGVTLPDKLDKKHQELFDQLSKVKGAEFDRAYAKDMVMGHQQAIMKLETQVKSGQNPELKTWAEKWLPNLREHLKLAQAAVKEVGK